MIVLFILFLIQFAVACAMLALNEVQRKQIAKWGWARLASDKDQSMLDKTQRSLDCCGFEEPNLEKDHPACGNVSQVRTMTPVWKYVWQVLIMLLHNCFPL